MKMYTDVHKYEQYCKLCEALEIQPLTYEEIHEHVDQEKIVEHIQEIETRSNQLGNAGSTIAAGFNKIWTNPTVQQGAQKVGDALFQTGKSYIHGMSWGSGANAVIDFVSDKATRFYGGDGNNGGGNSGGNEGGGNNNSNHSANHGMNNLQFKDNPMELKLDTGILNRVWTNSILAGSDEFSPMHMTGIHLSLENLLTNGDVAAYFSKAFYMKLVSFAQAKVNFSVSTLAAFNEDRVRNYFSALIDALNCYFYHVSIMNYFENPQNNNYAMTDLRNRISPEMMNQIVILQRQLTTCPVPPKLMNLLYYLNGNFKANHLDGSAIIKFETAESTLEYLSLCTKNLKQLEQTAALMSRIFPEWLYQDLPSYPGTSFHDYNFNTIWTNSPYAVNVNETDLFGPFPYYTDDNSVVYQTFSSELDGVSLALTSIYADGNFAPGFVTPKQSALVTTTSTNRITWDDNGWVNSALDTNHMASRMDTYPACALYTSLLIDPEVKSVCEPVRSVNLNTIRQAHFDFIDFMASFDLMSRKEPAVKNNRRPRRK